MSINPALFSSATDLWSTPQDFYDALDREFRFVLDAAATDENRKCAYWFTKEQDSLQQDWARYDSVWCNCPYGRTIGQWVAKAAAEAAKGATVVMLLPARTDTRYWHTFIEPIRLARPTDVRFVRGRLKFGSATNSAPFPSVVVVFRPPDAPPASPFVAN